MIEREPPKVLLKIRNERVLHEVRLRTFVPHWYKGELESFYAAFELWHAGERFCFNSNEVDIEYILAEDKVEV